MMLILQKNNNKDLLWEYYDNFSQYKKQNPEEMWGFHLLKKNVTGLPVNIFVDENSSYKMDVNCLSLEESFKKMNLLV